MEILVRASAIGIVAAVIGLVIKKSNPDITVLLTVAAGVAILFFALTMVTGIQGYLEDLAGIVGISPALMLPVIKSVGIAVTGRFAADICKDAGSGTTAAAVEFVSVASIIYVSMPLMGTLIQMLESFI